MYVCMDVFFGILMLLYVVFPITSTLKYKSDFSSPYFYLSNYLCNYLLLLLE